jgi:hypothetical protein
MIIFTGNKQDYFQCHIILPYVTLWFGSLGEDVLASEEWHCSVQSVGMLLWSVGHITCWGAFAVTTVWWGLQYWKFKRYDLVQEPDLRIFRSSNWDICTWVFVISGRFRRSQLGEMFTDIYIYISGDSATDWSLVQRSPTDCGASCVIKKPRIRGG